MAKINGTNLLVYDNGTLIAAQKGVTVNVKQNLFDVTSKDSAGWAEHSNGLRDADVSFEGLVSTTGLSAGSLFAHITARTTLLLVISGLDYVLVGEADLENSSITGPMEDAVTLSGSFRTKGGLYYLGGTMANLVTDPDGGATDYDTHTVSGISFTSMINSAGSAYCTSNAFGVSTGDVIKVYFFLTKTSGELPSVSIWDNTSADISNVVQCVEGMNQITLTCASIDASSSLRFANSGAANWSTSNIYAFKV